MGSSRRRSSRPLPAGGGWVPQPPVPLPSLEDAVRAARLAEHVARAALPDPVVPLEPRTPPEQLHVCYLMARTNTCGSARVVLEHAAGLTRAGVRVTLLSHHPRPDWHEVAGHFLQVPFGIELAEAVPLCDVVVAGYWDQLLPARAAVTAPLVHLEQGDEHLFAAQDPEREALVRRSLHAADATLVVSGTTARLLEERYGVRAEVLHDGVDRARFSPGPARGGRPYVLVVGADQNAFKGVGDVIAAHARLHEQGVDVDLVRVAPVPPLDPTGHVVVAPSQDELARLVREAAVLVCASRYEAFGLPPLEAMASGTPVVATRTAGLLEYAVDEQNALLVDVGDVEGIAAAVGRVLGEQELAEHLRTGGLATAASFDWGVITDRLGQLLRGWAGSRRALVAPLPEWQLEDLELEEPSDAARLVARLQSCPYAEVAVPVASRTCDGRELVQWQVVARRAAGLPGRVRAFLPARGPAAATEASLQDAYDALEGGRAPRAVELAVAAFRAAPRGPEQTRAACWVARALLAARQPAQALDVALSVLTEHPAHLDAWQLVGQAAQAARRPYDLDRVEAVLAALGAASYEPEWFRPQPASRERGTSTSSRSARRGARGPAASRV